MKTTSKNDPIVQHINYSFDLLAKFYGDFKLRHGLLEELFTEDDVLLLEAQRYTPQMISSFKRKGYGFMKLSYATGKNGINPLLMHPFLQLVSNSNKDDSKC